MKLDGYVTNFRDLGGMKTRDGKQVKPKRLLRSGELPQVAEEAAVILTEEYHLKNVIDLRTKEERQFSPDQEIPGTEYYILDFFACEDPEQSSNAKVGSEEDFRKFKSVEMVRDYMKELYRSFVTEASARNAINQCIRILLATEEGASLFHCFAGKDRTGITAAVVLTILGVSEKEILKDYLKTNEQRKHANQIILSQIMEKEEVQKLQTAAPESMEPLKNAVEAALCVEPGYLKTTYAMAEDIYGSFEDYIREGIGVDAVMWEKLQRMYLE